MLIIVLVLLYVTFRIIWYLIPGIKCGPPGIVNNPEPPGIVNNPEPPAISQAPKEDRKAADRIQLLDMDIKHYTAQFERLEHIKPRNTKQEIAIDEKRYRIERKIAAAALEMERLQTPE